VHELRQCGVDAMKDGFMFLTFAMGLITMFAWLFAALNEVTWQYWLAASATLVFLVCGFLAAVL
jgi:hypothetical protein